MSGPSVFALIIAAIGIGLPLMWFGVLYVIARFGGWDALAHYYEASSQPNGSGSRWIRLMMAPRWWQVTTYAKSVRLQADGDAIYLSAIGIFKAFHTPLRLPLDDMEIIETGQGHMKFVIGKSTEVKFARKPSIHLSFRQKDFDWIIETRENLMDK